MDHDWSRDEIDCKDLPSGFVCMAVSMQESFAETSSGVGAHTAIGVNLYDDAIYLRGCTSNGSSSNSLRYVAYNNANERNKNHLLVG